MAELSNIDKETLAARFGASVRQYDSVTPVQESMGRYLMERIGAHFSGREVWRILELGCGTGRITGCLMTAFPNAEITAIDIAQDMIAYAGTLHPGPDYVLADAEDFVRQDTSKYDLIVSNATAQWFNRPFETIERASKLLENGGLLAVATFAERTFQELLESFVRAYVLHGIPAKQHVVSMIPADDWRSRLPDSDIVEQDIQLQFADVMAFLRSIQAAGAVNSLAARSTIPKKVLQSMMKHCADHYSSPDGGQVFATYHACYVFRQG